MKRKILYIILFIASLFCLPLNNKICAYGSEIYEYEKIQYVDLGNVLNVNEDFEMSLPGQNYFAKATDLNTILSFGFKYQSELTARQWFGLLTKDFQWLYNYSFTITNPTNENGYITLGYGSDSEFLCFGKIESNEHFQEGQKYYVNVGVIELFNNKNSPTKVAERFKVEVSKKIDNTPSIVASGYYDNYNFDQTINNSSRGNSFYCYLDSQLLLSVGNYYIPPIIHDEKTYEAKTNSSDFSNVLGVNANYKHIAIGDYYINGSGSINHFMSIGIEYSKPTDERTFVAFNIQYGTSWNGNYSFSFSKNGNVTLGYGSDYQSWGFFNFGSFETNKKYILEYGAVELFSDEDLTNKVAERLKINLYSTKDDGSYILLGTASYDVYDYYDYFPANKRGNCTFIYQISGLSIGCGFYERDYKAVVISNDTYHVIDLSYGAHYDLSSYKIEKENYQFDGWYYLNSNNNKVFIPESGIWTYDFDMIIDGYHTCEIYANYTPNSYTIRYQITNGKNSPANKLSFSADNTVYLQDPIVNEGYLFKGWYDNASFAGDPITEIKAYHDVTVYAKIVKGYKIDFMYQNKIIDTIYIDENSSYTLLNSLKEIIVEKYLLDGKEISGNYQFTRDCTVQVIGTQKSYSISYELDGGTNDVTNPTSYTADCDFSLKNATKIGYLFGGWYLDENYKNEIKSLSSLSSNITLYARFYKMNEINQIVIIPSEDPYYLPQLITPNNSIVTIKLYDSNNHEIEISNKIYYYFTEEGNYTLTYHIETMYGEVVDKSIELMVQSSTIPSIPEQPEEANAGCKGNIDASYLGLLGLATILLKRYKKTK